MTFFLKNYSDARSRRFLLHLRLFVVFYGLILGGQSLVYAQNSEIDYHGFKADLSQIKDSPQIEAVIKAVKRQIEIVEQVKLSRENLDFFKSVPIVMIPEASGTPGSYNFAKNIVFLKARDLAANKPILLHEFLHAYHNLKIPNGIEKGRIRTFYQEAGAAYPNFKNDYFLSNPREFFAVTASIYLFGDIPRPPFNQSAIRQAQGEYYKYLETLFGSSNSQSTGTQP